ncbi:MAG: hypothetical protein WCD57_20845 [Acidobacteriaceae bacterium]
MTTTAIYRALLWLYPSEFRQQFSEEMVSIFEQRAGDRFADKGAVSFAFLLMEFSSIVKGANIMWFSKILPFRREPLESGATSTNILTAEEATKLRNEAIQKMVAAIADHDFVAARRFSDEETRLKRVLEDLQHTLAAHSKLA